jgi:hypothetical protein
MDLDSSLDYAAFVIILSVLVKPGAGILYVSWYSGERHSIA